MGNDYFQLNSVSLFKKIFFFLHFNYASFTDNLCNIVKPLTLQHSKHFQPTKTYTKLLSCTVQYILNTPWLFLFLFYFQSCFVDKVNLKERIYCTNRFHQPDGKRNGCCGSITFFMYNTTVPLCGEKPMPQKRIQNPKEQPPRALPECTSAPGAAASEELVPSTVWTARFQPFRCSCTARQQRGWTRQAYKPLSAMDKIIT